MTTGTIPCIENSDRQFFPIITVHMEHKSINKCIKYPSVKGNKTIMKTFRSFSIYTVCNFYRILAMMVTTHMMFIYTHRMLICCSVIPSCD